ncbi:MAG: hypothetical protein KC620_17190, partial [Myxococcales bacterium]|nr:hypothetical protein [Myxococcales bacterium]
MSATRPALALIGLGVRLPGADTPDALWRALREARRDAFGDRLPDEEPSIKASYGVPPVQRRSLARLQLLMLQVADDALADARLLGEGTDHARTDVICGTCAGFDRTYANAMRVASTRAIDLWLDRRTAAGLAPADPDGLRNRLRQSLRRRYGASPYDRVGEMASTIPARISMAFGLRGRAMAVEALDGTGFAAVEIAARNLRLGRCDTALVVVGQRIEGEWLPRALGAKWLISDPPGAPLALGGRGFRLGEGIIGLVLRRHADAQSAGQRVIATLDGFGRGHDSRRGSFRYPTAVDVRADALRTACAEAGIAPAGLGYVECFGSGIGTEERLELDGLLEAGVGPTAIGSSKWVFGHTFAASGLLGIAKMALALRARELPAEVLGGVDGEAVAPFRRPEAPEPWPADRRHAAVLGSGLDGSAYAVVLGAARAASPITAAPSVEPIALVSYGGRFAQADNAQRFWENIAHGRDLIGPLPESVLPARTFVRAQGVDMLSSYTAVGTCLTPPEAPPDGVKMPRKRSLALDAAQRHALHAGAELFARRARDGRPPPPGRGMVVVASSLCLDAERRSLVRERIGD